VPFVLAFYKASCMAKLWQVVQVTSSRQTKLVSFTIIEAPFLATNLKWTDKTALNQL